MADITDEITYNNKRYKLTWIKDSDLTSYEPVKQLYCVVFNEDGDILICRSRSGASWQIPGGKPEMDETYEEALKRELKEEVDVEIKNINHLGAQKVEIIENGNEKLDTYQLRFTAMLKKLNPQSKDPATDTIWERKFVPQNRITEFVKWGSIGEAMFDDAISSL